MTFVWYDTAKQYFQCFHGLELTRYFFFDTIKRFYFGVLQTDATGAEERGEPMLFYALLAATETLLIAGVAVLLLLGNLPPVIVVLLTVALVLLVFIFRPARTLLVRRQIRKRRVLHRHKMTRKHMDVLRTPSPIPPACVARLMEAGTLLTSDKAQTSALVSTLLDLNCRGFLSISMAEPLENMTMTLTPQQGRAPLSLLSRIYCACCKRWFVPLPVPACLFWWNMRRRTALRCVGVQIGFLRFWIGHY